MAIIKCKMCGGDLALIEGSTVAECEYCGTRQTVPVADSEKKLMLFARANRLRAGCEFDKAAGIYEAIVAEFPQEAEAYWGLVLCKYGIEYVDDPTTGKKIPTCHRSSFNCILADSDFEQALENADSPARRLYREEAKQIEQLRRNIIAVSATEDPYDIFICYKETDEDGNVVAEGDNSQGQCNVADWTDIVAVKTLGSYTVGLKSDGTVVITKNTLGLRNPDFRNPDLSGWTDIIAIDAGNAAIIGLKSDGTVVAAGSNEELVNGVKNWSDIVAVAGGTSGTGYGGHLLGLRKDGTVLAVGNNQYGECNVGKWEDVFAISGGWDFTLALRTDGKVLSTGCTWYNCCNVSDWTDIKQPTIPVLFERN